MAETDGARAAAQAVDDEIAALTNQVQELEQKIGELRKRRAPCPVEDYALQGTDGEVHLSELFGDRPDLLLIHFMGRSCAYCTLWADGFQGVLPYLESLCSVVLVSDEPVEETQAFADGRGWGLRVVSSQGSSLKDDTGFLDAEGRQLPGVAALRIGEDGQVQEVSKAYFGPGDRFCSVWHLFGLLADGVGDWRPRFQR